MNTALLQSFGSAQLQRNNNISFVPETVTGTISRDPGTIGPATSVGSGNIVQSGTGGATLPPGTVINTGNLTNSSFTPTVEKATTTATTTTTAPAVAEDPFYKKTWFMVAAGAVLLGVVLYFLLKK